MQNKKYSRIIFCLWIALFATGCTNKEEDTATARAKEFAENYFNLRFEEAFKICTQESRKWIAFYASNLTDKDFDAIRSAPEAAYVSSTDCELIADSTAVVHCVVCEALDTDSLEQSRGRIRPEATYLIPLIKKGKDWWVRMEGPLQNVK
ncbi:MAG: hypothetical protein LUC45_04875 [Paraprevotella sp.]|nr:hypothetical protein [Paraprevotella sp.]